MYSDIKIEFSVVIVIGKGNASAICIQGNAQRVGHLYKTPILILVIQIGLTAICHIEIEISIIVKISHFRRAISERAIAFIGIKSISRAKIRDKQIEISIIVEITPGRAKTRPGINRAKNIFYRRELLAVIAKKTVGSAIRQK